MSLSSEEITRYSRNILLNGVGKKGQEKLKSSVVSIVGLGGLGSPSALYLSAAGVGEIRIIDSDVVDLTNLQRQILYSTNSQNSSKARSAKLKLSELNDKIKITEVNTRITKSNIHEVLQGSHLVLEGSDNFETKFLVNDYCVLNSIPLLIAGILRFEGQVMGILPKRTACYRCTFLEMPEADSIPNCAEAGVLGSVAGIVGSIQATEALKYIIFGESELFGKILNCDFLSMELRKIERKRNKKCTVCGDTPKYIDLEHHEELDFNCKI